jgi:hypothetical protein
MLTLKRLGAYLITFFISVSLVIGLVNWKWMDNYLVNKANTIGSKDDIVNDEIVFVNLENTKHGNGGEDLKAFRQNVIKEQIKPPPKQLFWIFGLVMIPLN